MNLEANAGVSLQSEYTTGDLIIHTKYSFGGGKGEGQKP